MNIKGLPEEPAKKRDKLYQGLLVDIVLKQDQPTMTLTRGYIQDFLTSKDFHPRGIKVRLSKNNIQRLYDSSPKSKLKDVIYGVNNKNEDFIGRVQRVYYPSCFGILFLNKSGKTISEDFFNLFTTVYKDNNFWIINENSTFSFELKNELNNISNENIDIIVNEDSFEMYLNNFYLEIQNYADSINKKVNTYVYKNNNLVHLINGSQKLY